MKKKLFILMIIGICAESFAQVPIDFSTKNLYPELKKFNQSINLEIQKICEIQEIPQSEMSQSQGEGKFFSINYSTGQCPIRYVYMGRVNSCRTGGCSIFGESSENGEHEYFDYLILFDSIPTVRLVKVYNYAASHGQEITAKGWLKQFAGYDGSQSLRPGKNIDGISGATISVSGITGDLEERLEDLKKIKSLLSIAAN